MKLTGFESQQVLKGVYKSDLFYFEQNVPVYTGLC